MRQEKFTKGEWVVYEYCNGANVCVKNSFSIVDVEDCAVDLDWESKGFEHWGDDASLYFEIPVDEVKANAYLIAAAPEMYEMLQSLSEQDECQMFKCLINKLLAKARGEQ